MASDRTPAAAPLIRIPGLTVPICSCRVQLGWADLEWARDGVSSSRSDLLMPA